jgi:hypothetical protein
MKCEYAARDWEGTPFCKHEGENCRYREVEDDAIAELTQQIAALEAAVKEKNEKIVAQKHILDASTNYTTWKKQNDKIAALESEIAALKAKRTAENENADQMIRALQGEIVTLKAENMRLIMEDSCNG